MVKYRQKDLTLAFDEKVANPPKIYFDRNNNHEIDSSDIELPVQIVNGRVKIAASLVRKPYSYC